jgi:hypothetical protein
MTDPTPRQRGRPTSNKNSNSQIVINIWSWAPDGARQQDRLTDWPSVVIHSLTHSLVNRNKYPVVRPSWALKSGLTDRLVVGRKVTLTLTLTYGGWNFSTTRSSPRMYGNDWTKGTKQNQNRWIQGNRLGHTQPFIQWVPGALSPG